jgi:GGDEF domain-containing protein
MAPDGTSPDTDYMAFPASGDPNGQSPDGVPPPREQDLSDRNQTLSDEDQTLSDRDQEASDEDQAASDEDRVRAAKDRDQAANNRRRAADDRELAAHDRQEAGADGLTGARRRGVGLEDIKNEIHRARHTGVGLVVALVDVEGLKSINDELDHAAGHSLLREVAKELQMPRAF